MAETTKELVALAKRAAHSCFTEYLQAPDSTPPDRCAWLKDCVLSVFRDGSTAYDRASFRGAVLSAALTPENTASEDALARALLASAITQRSVQPRLKHDYRVKDPSYQAALAVEASEAHWWSAALGGTTATGRDKADALNALLDALLAKEPSDA